MMLNMIRMTAVMVASAMGTQTAATAEATSKGQAMAKYRHVNN